MQSVVIHLRAGIVQGCPANGIPNTCAITILNYSVRVDCFSLDELPHSIELASFAGFQ